MGKILNYLFVLTILFSIIYFLPSSIYAASFSFDPKTVSGRVGVPFQVEVVIDAGTDELSSTDATISYDKDILKVNEATDGTYMPILLKQTDVEGTIYIAAGYDDPASNASSGSGTLATISFEPIADGTATLTIDCANSKIVKNDVNATNVLTCASNGTAAVTVGAGSVAPTSLTPTTTVTELPRSGVFEDVAKWAIPGVMLLFVGLSARLLL